MADAEIISIFDEIYESTYEKTLAYVAKKCGNVADVDDILQETYAEVFLVLSRKGAGYLINAKAFVFRVAKMKLSRHYSLSQKLKAMVPLFFRNEDGEDVDITDLERTNPSVEDQLINHMVIEDIANMILSKPSDIQKAFYLYFYLELSMPQIAAEMAIKETTIKSRVYRTVKEIREIYGKDSDAR